MAAPAVSHNSQPSRAFGSHLTRRGWMFVAAMPVVFVIAMVAGEGLMSAMGYSGDDEPPLWLTLAVGGPLTLAAMVPGILAFMYGRQARLAGAGRRETAALMAIGGLGTVYWTFTFAASVVQRLMD